MCWYNSALPPPEESKKQVLIIRSIKAIVTPPARTGKDKTNKKTVTVIVQINKVWCSIDVAVRPRLIVDRKLAPPAILLAPAT
jgi:ribosome biogenesis SPOUT family RNA methylase Rps3